MKFQIRTIDLMIEQETIHHIRFLYSIAELGVGADVSLQWYCDIIAG